jgi:hypothetical protein
VLGARSPPLFLWLHPHFPNSTLESSSAVITAIVINKTFYPNSYFSKKDGVSDFGCTVRIKFSGSKF